MGEVLRVENLYKLYGFKKGFMIKAVDHISFSVNSGEVVGFLGPNGAGKSTTIKMIVGLAEPTEGNIYIMGKDTKKEREEAMRFVGGVIENPDLYKEWSAYENLMYLKSLSIDKNNQETFSKTLSKRKNEVLEVLKVVGLDSRMHDKVGHFSLGMKQRLGIAQAIMDNPKLLILDEPANGLDPAGIKEIRDMLRKCAEQLDMAVLVSSHQLAEMELMCDRFLIIDKGKITAEQKTSELTGGKEGTLRTIVVQVDKEKVDEVKVFLENYLKTEVLQKGDHVKFTTDKDISAITKELVINNFDVHSISPEKGRLEDTYLEATSKSKLGGRQ